jgi:hypothetical protein
MARRSSVRRSSSTAALKLVRAAMADYDEHYTLE